MLTYLELHEYILVHTLVQKGFPHWIYHIGNNTKREKRSCDEKITNFFIFFLNLRLNFIKHCFICHHCDAVCWYWTQDCCRVFINRAAIYRATPQSELFPAGLWIRTFYYAYHVTEYETSDLKTDWSGSAEIRTFFVCTGLAATYLCKPDWKSVLRSHDISVWIRIRGSMPLTNGSRSFYFHHWPSRCQQKTKLKKSFSAYYFLKLFLHNFL